MYQHNTNGGYVPPDNNDQKSSVLEYEDIHDDNNDLGYYGGSIGDRLRYISKYARKIWKCSKRSIISQLLITAGICGYVVASIYKGLNLLTNQTENMVPFVSMLVGVVKLFPVFLLLIIAVNAVIFYIRITFLPADGTYDESGKFVLSSKGDFGTAHIMSDEEKKEFVNVDTIEKTSEDILGFEKASTERVYSVNEHTKFITNGHKCVCGSSGSKKSRGVIMPDILQCIKRGESFICMEPKGEIFRKTAKLAEEEGYEVRILNYKPHEVQYSDSCNYLAGVGNSVSKARTIADIILRNTAGEDGVRGFWDDTQLNALQGTILMVTGSSRHPLQKNLVEVYKLLSEGPKSLSARFKALPEDHPAKLAGNFFTSAPENVQQSALSSLGVRLGALQDPNVQKAVTYDEIGFTNPGIKKCAYYIVVSDQESTLDFLASLYLNFSFIELVRIADEMDGKLPIRVQYILDEFPNVAEILDFYKKLATVRSRNIGITIAFQEISQMQHRYPDNVWSTIIGGCDINLFLGTINPETAEFYARRFGDTTIRVEQQNFSENVLLKNRMHYNYSMRSGTQKRALRTEEEIMDMSTTNTAYVFIKNKKLEVDKFDYTYHPLAKRIKEHNPIEHVPEWWKTQRQAEEASYVQRNSVQQGRVVDEKSSNLVNSAKQDKELQKVFGNRGKTQNGQHLSAQNQRTNISRQSSAVSSSNAVEVNSPSNGTLPKANLPKESDDKKKLFQNNEVYQNDDYDFSGIHEQREETAPSPFNDFEYDYADDSGLVLDRNVLSDTRIQKEQLKKVGTTKKKQSNKEKIKF